MCTDLIFHENASTLRNSYVKECERANECEVGRKFKLLCYDTSSKRFRFISKIVTSAIICWELSVYWLIKSFWQWAKFIDSLFRSHSLAPALNRTHIQIAFTIIRREKKNFSNKSGIGWFDGTTFIDHLAEIFSLHLFLYKYLLVPMPFCYHS